MLSIIYFWKDKQVQVYEGHNDSLSIRDAGFYHCFAVDSYSVSTDMRYGKYFKRGWEHVPLEEFPKAFRTNLLLLGIT